MSQIEELLHEADPVDRDDPSLDPRLPGNRAVLARALSQPAPAAAALRPRRRVAVALGATAAAAVAAGGILATPGGGPAVDAHAAMVQAAERASGHTSGRVVLATRLDDRRPGHHVVSSSDIRYEGVRYASVQHVEERLPDGREMRHDNEFRAVDGKRWQREGSGAWTPMPKPEGEPEPGVSFGEQVRRELGDRGLVEILRRADGATREGDTYRATVTVADLRRVPDPPAQLEPLTDGPVEMDDRRAHLSLTVDDDGTMTAFTALVDDPDLRVEFRTEYRDLGAPQGIEAP
jgi:hypothetical protein